MLCTVAPYGLITLFTLSPCRPLHLFTLSPCRHANLVALSTLSTFTWPPFVNFSDCQYCYPFQVCTFALCHSVHPFYNQVQTYLLHLFTSPPLPPVHLFTLFPLSPCRQVHLPPCHLVTLFTIHFRYTQQLLAPSLSDAVTLFPFSPFHIHPVTLPPGHMDASFTPCTFAPFTSRRL